MLWKKEKKVRRMIYEHAEKVGETLENMSATLNEYLKGDLLNAKEFSFKTHTAESEADNIRRTIIDELKNGAFFPHMRGDIMSYIVLQDNIANQAEAVCDYIICQKPELVPEISEDLQKLCDRSIVCFGHLKTAVSELSKEMEKTRGNTAQIRQIEEEIDKEEWHITQNLFESESSLEKKMHLRDFIWQITKITDLTEDAGDFLEAITIKMVV